MLIPDQKNKFSIINLRNKVPRKNVSPHKDFKVLMVCISMEGCTARFGKIELWKILNVYRKDLLEVCNFIFSSSVEQKKS